MTSLVDGLDRLGAGLVPWILAMTAWTGLLLIAALLIDRVLARRVAACWRVLLFSVVFVRLMLPLAWTSPGSILGRSAEVLPRSTMAAVSSASRESARPPIETILHPVSHAWLGASYLLGGLGVLTLGFACRRRLAREIASAIPARPALASIVRSCPVLEHPSLGPLVVGAWRPRIVLPTPLIERLTTREMADILRHEAAHVRRRDPVLAAILQAACAVAWPVLPAWLAARRMRALIEEACDDAALEQASPDERRAYGKTLVRVADWHPRRMPLALSAGLLGFGSALRERVSALRFMTRWPGVAQAGSVAAASAVFLVTLGAAAPERAPPSADPAPAADGSVGAPIIRLPDPTLDATGFPTLSPFQAIRWRDEIAEVSVAATWHELAAIDGIAVTEILAFCHATYDFNWRKRFEEDLVAVMTRMGHPLGDTVMLDMRRLDDGSTVRLSEVPMTHENRQALRRTARDAAAGETAVPGLSVPDPAETLQAASDAWILPDACRATRLAENGEHRWTIYGTCDDKEALGAALRALGEVKQVKAARFAVVPGDGSEPVQWFVEFSSDPEARAPQAIDASRKVVSFREASGLPAPTTPPGAVE